MISRTLSGESGICLGGGAFVSRLHCTGVSLITSWSVNIPSGFVSFCFVTVWTFSREVSTNDGYILLSRRRHALNCAKRFCREYLPTLDVPRESIATAVLYD